jgi:hypothetical protein
MIFEINCRLHNEQSLQRLSPAQQANLQKMGYQVPKGNDTTKSWYDGPLGTASAPFRWSVSDVLLPRGADLLNGLTYAQDQLIGRPIRTLSDLSTPTKIAAGAGGLAAGYVGFAAATAMAANPYMAIGLAGFSALFGATASAYLVETIQGNPSRFTNSWQRAGEGEKFFTRESVNKATELLGDEGLITLAETFAQQLGNQTDLVALVREMAGQRDATLIENQFDQILKIAETITEPNTDAYFQTVAALETIIQEPIFQEAIVTLQQGKVSLGRIAARRLGLNPNSSGYNFISGMVDATTMIAMDPLLLVAGGVKAFKIARYGMEFADGAVMANKFQEMYSSKKAIQRVFDVVAKGVVNGDSRVIARYTPQWLPLYDQLRTYYNAVKEMPDFDGFSGQQVVNFITDGQRFSAIMQGIGITQGTTRQTLKTLGAGNYLLRSSGGVLGDFLRGAGDASIYSVIEKISKNADFQKDLINFIPLELREDFFQLVNNTEMSNAYKAGLKLAEAPGIGAVLRPIGAFKEGLVTPALTKQAITLIDRPEAVKDITDLVRSFNQIGLSSFMQDIWIKTIIDNPNFQGRVDAIAAMIDSLATAGNLRQTRQGSDFLDEILTHFKQHYAFGKAGSMSTTTGYWKMDKVGALPIRDAQSIMIALPDMKLLRQATANATWFRTLLNIPEGQYIQTFQNKIWKPAVLFKYGFALRNSGEDLLAMIARAGSGYFMQELAGRSIGNYDARLEAKLVLDEFMKTGPNVRKGARLTERQKWLLYKQYDVPTHIRPLVRAISRLGSGKDPKYVIGKNYGKWLATFLRGSKRQDTALVDLMRYFRGGAQSAADRGFLENLSLSPSIIKDNFRAMGDMLIYGNEYSWRRMLVGGVDQRKVIAGKLWAEENIVALMDRLGTGAGLPLDLDIPTLSNQREFGGKTQVRLSNGERGVVRHGEQNRLLEDFHVSVHERTSELSDDPLVSQVKQALLKVYGPDLQEIVPPSELKDIIDVWKYFLELSTDELGGINALEAQMWFILNEPIEHPERVRRYQAILNQLKDSPLHKELVSRYGGLKVPTPQEYLKLLSDQINVDASGVSRLTDLTLLVEDIPEPAKTWVMANLYQDWATDGQHFGPEFTRWNGQSVGRSKGQPIYRAMQRPGEQYVINPDGSITLFFQDQSHWEDAEALSMSLSYEQTLKYLGGIFTRGQTVGPDVIFTSTVDDVFGAHGITKNNIIWRDYERTGFGWDYENNRPIKFPERGAAFVQGPEAPYQLGQPESWKYNAESGRRELAFHAEIKRQQSPVQAVLDRRNSLQEQVDELNNYLASDKFMDDAFDLQMTYDDYNSEEAASQAMDAIYQKISDQLDPLVEEVANLNVTLRENGLDPEEYDLPRSERNSITIPAGSYTLSYPGNVDDFIETSSFADYSTSPFYSSFDEIESSLDMELARIIESGEFDDVLNLNRRVVNTGPTQKVFAIDLSNLPPYIKDEAYKSNKLLPSFNTREPGTAEIVDGELVSINYNSLLSETPSPENIGPGDIQTYTNVPRNINELIYQAIDTRSPLVFSTEEAANFYLKQVNELLDTLTPYRPKGLVARNLEQQYFIPEVKPVYLPIKDPADLTPIPVEKFDPNSTPNWRITNENQLFAGSSERSSIPFARKRYSTPSRKEVQKILNDPNFTDTPIEAFDVIGWPVDNYPVVSEYLYDAATQGSQPQIIEAARETIKQRVKAGRRIDYTAKRDGTLWILNEGRPMELKAGDVLPSTKVFSDPRMAEEDLVNLGDMRFMDESEIRYGGDADINWHTIAPLLYDDAEKLSGRKLYEGTQSASIDGKEVYLDNIPVPRFSLHDVQNSPAGNLPNLEIASVYEDISSGSLAFDKVVQYGFGKILGPIMDAISRKPMAFHAFSIALERNLKNIDWMLYGTPEELALNALADVFHSKNIFGPQSSKTLERWSDVGRQVGLSHGVPEAEYWSNGEAISYIRGFNGEDFDLALDVLKNTSVDSQVNALINFAKKNKGNVITGDRTIGGSWDFLDYMTSQLTADVITSGGADWAIRALIKQTTEQGVPSARVRSILDELQPEDFQTLKSAWNTREKAFENAKFYAQEATIRDMMPFIDTHEIRSQFADHGRGFMPFFYAEENFLKRWARIASMDSGMNGIAALRKFQLQYTGLREMGVIRQSETGDDYFVMPGTDLFIEGLANITGLELGLTGMLTQQVNKMLPGIGKRFGAPSFSPLVIMPLSFIAGRFPDFEPLQDLERNVIGEDNALDRNWYSHLLPSTMVNTVRAIKLASANQNELRQDEKLSSYFNAGYGSFNGSR